MTFVFINFNEVQSRISNFKQSLSNPRWYKIGIFFTGANQNIENKEKKKPFQVAKPEVVEALRKLLSNKRGGWNNKRGKLPKNQG